jgi:hypothetical protein
MNRLAGLPFQQGQHICAIYDTPEEQVSVAARYIADGLDKNERCLYVGSSAPDLDGFRVRLRALGVEVDAAEAGGALLLLTAGEAHLEDGRFECERMLRMLNESLEKALDDGFIGLRTCGDMTWLADTPPGADQVIEYEAVLNELFRNVRGLGMCQYDRKRLPAHVVAHAGICAHSSLVVEGSHQPNPGYDPASVLHGNGPRPATRQVRPGGLSRWTWRRPTGQ